MDTTTVNSILLTVSSLLLAGLTAAYVVITAKLLEESRRANEVNQESFRRQLQFALLPHVSCTARLGDEEEVLLTVQNPGSMPANDVDILAVASYLESDITPESFIGRYVEKESDQKKRLFENEDGFFGVYDHIVYFSMPQHKQVTVTLHLPLPTEFLWVLLQFRDVVGTNYHRLFWFFAEHENSGSSRFRLGGVDPQAVESHSRVTFKTSQDLKLVTDDGSPLPEYVVAEFVPL